jgi:hypothetical protein
MLKAIAFTMLVPLALVAVICAAISFRLMPSGLWRIGPVIGVNWNGGVKARFWLGHCWISDWQLAV